MRSLRSLSGPLLVVLLAALPAAAQDWRGTGRVDGWVKDSSGKGVPDATVQLTREKGGGGPSVKTDKKGYWAVLGLVGGRWNLDVSAAGYETRKLSVNISEINRIPPMDIQLQKSATQAPPPPELDAAAKAGAEAVAAVTEGNRLVGEKKYAEARAQYEKAIALLPPNAALLKGVAQTYHGEGNDAKAIETLRKVVELDPADTDTKLLLASMLVELGQADEGKGLIEGLPPGTVKDPAIYVNLGISFMNKKKPDDAAVYLTRAIEIDPAQADGYYYRGLAYIQGKRNAQAKADFRKYLELAPNGPEAKEVKEMLQALK